VKFRPNQPREVQIANADVEFYYMPWMSIDGMFDAMDTYNQAILDYAREMASRSWTTARQCRQTLSTSATPCTCLTKARRRWPIGSSGNLRTSAELKARDRKRRGLRKTALRRKRSANMPGTVNMLVEDLPIDFTKRHDRC
jgi:hypothetical protein